MSVANIEQILKKDRLFQRETDRTQRKRTLFLSPRKPLFVAVFVKVLYIVTTASTITFTNLSRCFQALLLSF